MPLTSLTSRTKKQKDSSQHHDQLPTISYASLPMYSQVIVEKPLGLLTKQQTLAKQDTLTSLKWGIITKDESPGII